MLAVFRRGVRAHRGPVGQGGARAPRPISAADDTVNGYGPGLEPGSPFPETDYTDSLPFGRPDTSTTITPVKRVHHTFPLDMFSSKEILYPT